MPELWFLAMLLAATDPLPPDVKVFVERRSQCEHWAGEELYDAPRAAEIEAALRQFHCDSVEADEVRIRRHYARYPVVLKALNTEPF